MTLFLLISLSPSFSHTVSVSLSLYFSVALSPHLTLIVSITHSLIVSVSLYIYINPIVLVTPSPWSFHPSAMFSQGGLITPDPSREVVVQFRNQGNIYMATAILWPQHEGPRAFRSFLCRFGLFCLLLHFCARFHTFSAVCFWSSFLTVHFQRFSRYVLVVM